MTIKDIKLSALVAADGFRINGIAPGDLSGTSVSGAGDVNKDGIADLIIGAPNADFSGSDSGQSYVLFGRRTFALDNSLSALDGSTGFRVGGIAAGDNSGRSVSTSDMNGDGFADVVIGAPGSDVNGVDSGQAYVVFGRSGPFAPNINPSTFDGNNGFRINGAGGGDALGTSVNGSFAPGSGSGLLIVGAPGDDFDPNSTDIGQSYGIFGRSGSFAPVINPLQLNGNNGFSILGIAAGDRSGTFVSRGDVNGDKIPDVIVGAPDTDVLTFSRNSADGKLVDAGRVYVVFGRTSGTSAFINPLTLNGRNGFQITGVATGDLLGASISSGDINGDGSADLIIGAPKADPGGRTDAGQVYVVFGRSQGFASNIDLANLDPNVGFRMDGLVAGDNLGASVSSGDVNGDKLADIIIGAPGTNAGNLEDSGRTYVVFGRRLTGAAAQVDLSAIAGNLDSPLGRKIDGAQAGERSGSSVSTSNVNGDACDDVIIGAPNADTTGGTDSGRTYVVFGNFVEIANLVESNSTVNASRVRQGAINANLTTGELILNPDTPDELIRPIEGNKIIGTRFNDTLIGNAGANTLSGDGGKDTLTGGEGRDRFVFGLATRGNFKQLGVDTITDFTRGQDKIVLDRNTFRGVNRISFASVKNRGAAQRSEATFTYIRSSGALFFNANGSQNGFGTGGQFADLTNGLNLRGNDLQLGRV
jgi:Ca2+-binding RTX toxin-like protein